MALPVIGGLVLGGLSALSGASSQNSARRAEQQRINRQFKYDKQVDQYNWDQTLRDYNFRLTENAVSRNNQENNLRYQEETLRRNYAYDLQIRDYEYNNQVRQYNESERIYGLQRGSNAQAAQLAYSNENRRYQELITSMAFDQQDMLVKMLQEEGQIQASGISGRSASKTLASAMAGYGRNQAILAESLLSASKDSAASRRQIDLDRYSADLNADARRMLTPLKAPAPMAPLAMPRANILDPSKPVRGPKPIKGTNTVPSANAFSVASNFLSTGLNAYQMFGGKFS